MSESPQGLIARLGTHALVLTLAQLVQGLLLYFLLLLYTAYLDPAAYGRVELLVVSIAIASAIAFQGLPSAVSRRFNYDWADDEGMRRVTVSTGLSLIVVGTASLGLACALASRPLAGLLLDDRELWPLVLAAAVGVSFHAVASLGSAVLRGSYRSLALSAVTLAGFLANAGLTVLLLVAAGLGMAALVYGTLLGQVVTGGLTLLAIRRHLGRTWSGTEKRELLAYGRPLIFSAIGLQVLLLSDRYFVRAFVDADSVGVYSMGARFAAFAGLVFASFRGMWPSTYFRLAKADDAPWRFARFTTRFFGLGGFLVVGWMLFAEVPIMLLRPAFRGAEAYVGPLAGAALLYTLGDVLKVGLNITGRTRLLPVRFVIAALLNLGLNAALVPRWGAMGAALSTLLAFGAFCFITVALARRVYPVPYETGRLTVAGLILAAGVLGYVATRELDTPLRLGARALVLAALGAGLLAARVLVWSEIRSLLRVTYPVRAAGRAVAAMRREWRRARVLRPRSRRRLLERASTLLGRGLAYTGEPRVEAPWSGAVLLPARAVDDASRRYLLKVGHGDLRRKLREHHEALQRLRSLPELPESWRGVLPAEHGLLELEGGVLLAVADRAPGVPLRELLGRGERAEAAEVRALDLLIDLHRATRSLPQPDPLPDALDAMVEVMIDRGCLEPVVPLLRATAAEYRGRAAAMQLPAVLRHGDFHAGNILVDPESHEITAVLDLDRPLRPDFFPCFDIYHFLVRRRCFATGAAASAVIDREFFAPSAATWAGAQVARYYEALEIPPAAAPLQGFVYVVDHVVDRLGHEDAVSGRDLMTEFAPHLRWLAEQVEAMP